MIWPAFSKRTILIFGCSEGSSRSVCGAPGTGKEPLYISRTGQVICRCNALTSSNWAFACDHNDGLSSTRARATRAEDSTIATYSSSGGSGAPGGNWRSEETMRSSWVCVLRLRSHANHALHQALYHSEFVIAWISLS